MIFWPSSRAGTPHEQMFDPGPRPTLPWCWRNRRKLITSALSGPAGIPEIAAGVRMSFARLRPAMLLLHGGKGDAQVGDTFLKLISKLAHSKTLQQRLFNCWKV